MPAYTPEPIPLSIDPVLAEYLNRELMRISNTFIGGDEVVDAFDYQPHDADLDAISVLVTQAYGRNFLTYANEAAFKASVNLEANIDFDPAVHLQAAKVTPVNADELGIADSAASFVWKRVTWANIKAAITTIANTWSALQTFTANVTISGNAPTINFTDTDALAHDYLVHANSNNFYILVDRNGDGAHEAPYPVILDSVNNIGYIFGDQVWTTGNDGTGSGLDADVLDGLQSTTAATANTISARDGAADLTARLHRTEWTGLGWNGTHLIGINANGGVGTDNYMRPVTVANAISALIPAYGAVGSYIFGYIVPSSFGGTNIIENGNYAGNLIQPASVFAGSIGDDGNGGTQSRTKGGSVLAGTWRALGRYNTAVSTNGVLTLFQRIA